MTFQEWWMLPKPAECDELKEVFRGCWQTATEEEKRRAANDD